MLHYINQNLNVTDHTHDNSYILHIIKKLHILALMLNFKCKL